MFQRIGFAFGCVLIIAGCPQLTFEPSPGGVEGRWTAGEFSLADSLPGVLPSYYGAQLSETVFTFSGNTATIENIQTSASGLQRASLITTTTATFDAVESETEPALLFSNAQRTRTPSDAEIDQYISVLISALSEEDRSVLEAGTFLGQTLEESLENALRLGLSLGEANPGLVFNCDSSGCAPVPFLLDGDMLMLTFTTGFGGGYELTPVQ